jgi:hypothetical protein
VLECFEEILVNSDFRHKAFNRNLEVRAAALTQIFSRGVPREKTSPNSGVNGNSFP